MSTYADAGKARVWEDGDVFRAPAGTAMPADPFADDLETFEALGGIKAGFTVTTAIEGNDALDVWNNKSGAAYRKKAGVKTPTITLRPVDYSNGTMALLLSGGSAVETVAADPLAEPPVVGSGIYELTEGTDTEFVLLLRVYDGDKKKAYFVARGEQNTVPEEALNGEDIDGWDIEVTPLAPADGSKAIRKFTNWDATPSE